MNKEEHLSVCINTMNDVVLSVPPHGLLCEDSFKLSDALYIYLLYGQQLMATTASRRRKRGRRRKRRRRRRRSILATVGQVISLCHCTAREVVRLSAVTGPIPELRAEKNFHRFLTPRQWRSSPLLRHKGQATAGVGSTRRGSCPS